MSKLTLTTTLITGLMAVTAATPALAGRWDNDGMVYAPVVSSRPFYTQVQVAQPQQVCRNEQVVYNEPVYRQGNNPAGTILGGIIGGVIGHQFGGGRGNAVATGIGAVVGAGVGNQAGSYQGTTQRVAYQQRCDTVTSYRTEQRIDGYDVTYNYGGRLYNTRLPYDPGNRIAVNVSVQPVRY